jgi:hypothetical protein
MSVDAGEAVQGGGGVELGKVRQMWHLLEPLHAVLYYAPEVFEEAAALGFDIGDRWPSYFPLRAAPLGAVGSERVASAFYSFSPRMVAEHMDQAWVTAILGRCWRRGSGASTGRTERYWATASTVPSLPKPPRSPAAWRSR